MEPEDQLALLPKDIRSPDEFAEEFDTEFGRIRHFGPGDLTPAQMRICEEINGLLNSMTDSGDDSIWELESLRSRSEWGAIRDLAKAAMSTDGWPSVNPDDLRSAFGDPADEKAYKRAIQRLRAPDHRVRA
jgi:hypothetical protein